MRDTGIIRRVDVLGRVVVPKEIRKVLKINEGDPLEIFTEKDGVYLKKYSPVKAFGGIADAAAKSLYKMTGKTVIVTDRDASVCVYGKYSGRAGEKISADLAKVISEKTEITVNFDEGKTPLPVRDDSEKEFRNQFVKPIISGGTPYGAVILADEDKNSKISSTDAELTRLTAEIIADKL